MAILQGNFGVAGVSPLGVDYLDYSDGFNTSGPFTAMLGSQKGQLAAINAFFDTSGSVFNWIQGTAGTAVAGMQVRRKGALTTAAHGALWSLPRWPFGGSRATALLGEPIPSVRFRFDAIIQAVSNAGLPDFMSVGFAGGGAQSFRDGASNTGVAIEVDSATGMYSQIIEKPAAAPGINVLGPAPGGLDATTPHTVSLELISGPVNRVRLSVFGALVFERETSGAILPVNTFGNAGAGPHIAAPAGAVGVLGFWAYHAGRVRIDYV